MNALNDIHIYPDLEAEFHNLEGYLCHCIPTIKESGRNEMGQILVYVLHHENRN